MLKFVDQGSILLVVYSAFSEAVIEGLWQQMSAQRAARPAAGLRSCCSRSRWSATTWLARGSGFNRADQITIIFCGSKKSLATGVPMAKVLFASQRSARSCCR